MVSVVCAGLFGVVQRMQQIRFENKTTNEFMVIALGFLSMTSFIMGVIMDRKDCLSILKNGLPFASGAGVSNEITNTLNMLAYTLIPISIVAPTNAGVKIVISFLLSCFLFKEKFLKRQV